MIISTGLDAVDVIRFKNWKNFSQKQLSKIFSHDELDYAFSIPQKTAERLAVRFAAKEATYKAISPLLAQQISFSIAAKLISTEKNQVSGAPILIISWDKLPLKNPSQKYQANVSFTHTQTTAIAMVLITQIC